MTEHLSSKHRALSSDHSTAKKKNANARVFPLLNSRKLVHGTGSYFILGYNLCLHLSLRIQFSLFNALFLRPAFSGRHELSRPGQHSCALSLCFSPLDHEKLQHHSSQVETCCRSREAEPASSLGTSTAMAALALSDI